MSKSILLRRAQGSDKKPAAKITSEEIEEHVKEFLKKGGKIKKIKQGDSAFNPLDKPKFPDYKKRR